jgi:NitT/TauT family transport system substrate-binding protein
MHGEESTDMRISRRLVLGFGAIAIAASVLAGCSSGGSQSDLSPMRIGMVPSEDCLPLWVAERDGLFKNAGMSVELKAYASPEERDAALKDGAVDVIASDVVGAARQRATGVPVKIVTLMLGATPSEGRYGIAVKPGSAVTSLVDLAGKPVGTSSGTMEEYVFTSLMYQAGLGPTEIKKQSSKNVATRLENLVGGKLDAALLPEPYLMLAEKRGAKVVAQDTSDTNLSQTVLVAAERYLDTRGGSASCAKLLEVWTSAAAAIDKDPASFRALLVSKIEAAKPLEKTYRVGTYPKAQLPTLDDTEAALDWMSAAKPLPSEVTYEALIWKLPASSPAP